MGLASGLLKLGGYGVKKVRWGRLHEIFHIFLSPLKMRSDLSPVFT